MSELTVDTSVILLAEDREADIILVRHAFKKANLLNPLHVVHDGAEAIAYLSGEDPYANRAEYPLPALVLLDLKMPLVNGFEVLKWIRSDPHFSALRVVVLTVSDEMQDVNRAYQLGANSFLVKPMDFQNLAPLINAFQGCWLWTHQPPMSRSAPEIRRGVQ